MWKKRIACLTYHKYPGEDWPESEFCKYEVKLAFGHEVTMLLAERGTFLGGRIWVREIRKLTRTGHQTAIISTDYLRDLGRISVTMFARWSQENFFKYMRENFSIDTLTDYSTENISKSTRVVCPLYLEGGSGCKKTGCPAWQKKMPM